MAEYLHFLVRVLVVGNFIKIYNAGKVFNQIAAISNLVENHTCNYDENRKEVSQVEVVIVYVVLRQLRHIVLRDEVGHR